jgi:hypothetical protein
LGLFRRKPSGGGKDKNEPSSAQPNALVSGPGVQSESSNTLASQSSTNFSETRVPRTRTVPKEEVEKTRRQLRTLLLEKELVSSALTRLYEAEAAQEITRDEREILATKYRGELKSLDDQIITIDAFIEVGDLETLREQLLQLVTQKIDAIELRIGRTKPKAAPLIAEIEARSQKKETGVDSTKSRLEKTPKPQIAFGSRVPDISDLVTKPLTQGQPEKTELEVAAVPEPQRKKATEQEPMVPELEAKPRDVSLGASTVSVGSEPKAVTSPAQKKVGSSSQASDGDDQVEELHKELLEALDRLEKLDVDA